MKLCLRCNDRLDDIHEGVLCDKCLEKWRILQEQLFKEFTGSDDVKQGFALMLKGLSEDFGLDLTDPNFFGTPGRVARMYGEIFKGVKDTNRQVRDILSVSFPSSYTQIILATDIQVYSMCPHHFLPVEYKIHVAYIPSEQGRVIGASKLSRLAVVLASRPVLQEQFTEDITNCLMDHVDGCLGAACIVQGRHFCMIMRGIKQPYSKLVTSSMKGAFMEEASTRQELFDLIKLNSNP